MRRATECKIPIRDCAWTTASILIAIPAPLAGGQVQLKAQSNGLDLVERARARAAAVARETLAISGSFAEAAPRKGPKPG